MKTALLIDEDRVVRLSLAQWLRDADWHVLEAEEGESGLALAVEKKPDLILCDLHVPRCNGFQICRTLRTQGDSFTATRIIVTTSSGYGVDRQIALQAGADEYLIKPILQADFVKLLKQFGANGHTATLAATAAPAAGHRTDDPTRALAEAIPPGELTVRFWGVRGSIPTPGKATAYYGGNTSCVEVRADGQLVILDAGTGIRGLGLSLVEEFKDQPLSLTLLISHTHWDHIQGFPFFDPAYNPKNQLRILGYEGARDGLLATLSSQMESPYFPVGWQELPSHIKIEELKGSKFNLGPIEVETIFLNHPGICVGYRLNTSGGSVAYLPDNEPFQRYKYHSAGETAVAGSTEFLEFARRMDQRLIDFVKDVDVLIFDSQYDATEYQTRVGWGHGCVDDVVALATHADAKRLYLFHHDPGHDDDKITKMAGWGQEFVTMLGQNLHVEAAREGVAVVIKAEKTNG